MLINLRDQVSFRSLVFFTLANFTAIFPQLESLFDVELIESVQSFHNQINALADPNLIRFVFFDESCEEFLEIGVYVM